MMDHRVYASASRPVLAARAIYVLLGLGNCSLTLLRTAVAVVQYVAVDKCDVPTTNLELIRNPNDTKLLTILTFMPKV